MRCDRVALALRRALTRLPPPRRGACARDPQPPHRSPRPRRRRSAFVSARGPKESCALGTRRSSTPTSARSPGACSSSSAGSASRSVVTFLGDDIAPALAPWWSWWIDDGSSADADWPARLRELFEEADLLLAEGPLLRERVLELGAVTPDKVAASSALECRSTSSRSEPRPAPAGRRDRPGVRRPLLRAEGRALRARGRERALRARGTRRRAPPDRRRHDDRGRATPAEVHAYDPRRSDLEGLAFGCSASSTRPDCMRGDAATATCSSTRASSTATDAARAARPPRSSRRRRSGCRSSPRCHCDIPNVTRPGESALLVPERDTPALVDALRTLIDDPSRWEAMGRAGRAHVEDLHDIAKEARRLDDRYAALLA